MVSTLGAIGEGGFEPARLRSETFRELGSELDLDDDDEEERMRPATPRIQNSILSSTVSLIPSLYSAFMPVS
jgi:hypothetical protein